MAQGRTRDPKRYQLYSEWLKSELDIEISPEDCENAVANYQSFQKSPVNVKYNADRAAARSEAAQEAKDRAAARKAGKAQADDADETPAEKPKPATRGKRAPAAKKAASSVSGATAKKTAARRPRGRAAATEAPAEQ